MKRIISIALLAVVVLTASICYGEKVTINFDPSDVSIAEVQRQGVTYFQLEFSNNVKNNYVLSVFRESDSVGFPEIPCRNAMLAIPFGHKAEVTNVVLGGEMPIFQGEETYIIPAQPKLPTKDGYNFPQFQQAKAEGYQELNGYPKPEESVRLVDIGILENYTIATLRIVPFWYDPVNGNLLLFTTVSFELITVPDDLQMDNIGGITIVWPEYIPYPEDCIKRMVENPLQMAQFAAPFRKIPETPQRPWIFELIVVPDSSYIIEANRLKLWRTDTHKRAEIITMEQIANSGYFGDLPEKMRQTFKHWYLTNGTKAFLVVGTESESIRYLYPYDTDTSPQDLPNLHIGNSLYLGEFSRKYGDWDFDRDGLYGEPTDDRPNLFNAGCVGTVPARTPQEFGDYVDKVISYESNGSGGNLLWATTCADQMLYSGQQLYCPMYVPEYVPVDNYSIIEKPDGYNENPVGSFGEEVVNFIRVNKPDYVVDIAHASPDHSAPMARRFNTPPKSYVSTRIENGGYGHHGYIPSLAGSHNKNVSWTMGCDLAAYDARYWYGDVKSVGEEYLLVPDGGAVIYCGHSRFGWVASSRYMTAKFWDHIFNYPGENIAGIAFRNTRLNFPNYRDENFTMALLGDPAVEIYTDHSKEFQVFLPPGYILDPGQVEISAIVLDNNSEPAEGSVICVRQRERFRYGLVGSNGMLYDPNGNPLTFMVRGTEGSVKLTINQPLGSGWNYKVNQVTIPVNLGEDEHSNDREGVANLPTEFALSQNLPNPFNTTTTINFALPEDRQVTIEVYNLLGQKVATLLDDYQAAGYHQVTWDAKDNSSGIYFYRLTANERVFTKRMTLLK